MNEILLFVASMPVFVVDAVAGALAILIGGMAGFIAEKYFGLAKGWIFVPAFLLAVILVNGSRWPLEDAAPLENISKLKKQSRLFSLIFKYHPEAEREAFAQLKKILSGPHKQAESAAAALSVEITNRYLNLHMLTASDAAIHRLLQTEANILEALKNNPTECVAQYLGTPSASRFKAIPRSLGEASLDARAEIIESSVVSPSPPPETANIDNIASVITSAYRARGYDTAEIAKAGNVESLPPGEGCEVGYRFLSALASMDEKQSSFVYKVLIQRLQTLWVSALE